VVADRRALDRRQPGRHQLPATVIGVVPADWRARRTVGEAQIAGLYLEIGAKESLAWLR